MKIALAQIDMRLGDIEGVCARLEQQAALAVEAGADLLALPAPLLTGVLPGSLVDYPAFEHDVLSALAVVAQAPAVRELTVLVPAVVGVDGSQLFEVYMLRRGRVVPTRLTVARHYAELGCTPWTPPVFEIAGSRVAVTFDFERDITELPAGCDVAVYFQVDGFDAADAGTAAVAAVPGGAFRSEVAQASVWLACMAPVGAFDAAVYTGGSFVMDDTGRVVAAAPPFEESLLIQEVARGTRMPAVEDHELPSFSREAWVWEALRLHLRDTVEAVGLSRVAVPLAGDLPTSLLAVLAVDALGPRNVVGVVLEHTDVLRRARRMHANERLEDARALADRLGIRVVEPEEMPLPALASERVPDAERAWWHDAADELVLAAVARAQRAVPLSALTKTDAALAGGAYAAGLVAPFGDVYLSALEALACLRGRASGVLPTSATGPAAVAERMGTIVARAARSLADDEALAARAEETLQGLSPFKVDQLLEAHVDRNIAFVDLDLVRTAPEAAGLLLMLVRSSERARRRMPAYPIVSARSFAERAWPESLAWSDLGTSDEETLRAADLADTEFQRLERRGAKRGELARGEVLGMLGAMFGLSSEQQAELASEEGQQRLQEGLQDLEAQVREAIARMSQTRGSAGGAPGVPGSVPFFSLN